MKIKFFPFFTLSLLFFSQLAAVDWIAYATDVSNFKILSFDLMTQAIGSINSQRCEEIAITPDASTLYVINQNSPNSLSVINLTTQPPTVTDVPLNVGSVDQIPLSIAITPDGTTAYITAFVSATSQANLLKFDLASNTYTVIPLVPNIEANALAITPDGSMVYVTQTNAIVGMNTMNNTFGTPIPVPGRSTRIAIAPTGLLAYVSDMINSQLYVIDLVSQTVSQTINLTASSQPTNIAVSADNQWVFLANENSNSATAINIATSPAAVTNILLGSTVGTNYTQQGVAISPDSQTAVFTNANSSQFSTVAVGTNQVTNTPASGFPNFVAITPDQAPVASFISAISPPLSASTFTSTSTTQVGTIASYTWDFGDGNSVTTATNPINHTYLNGGTYNVTLTVTNSAGTSTTQTFTGQTVSQNGGPSATITNSIAVPFLLPTVTSVNPATGTTGTVVTIVGSHLTGATNVQFGSVAALFNVLSDTTITAIAPAGNTGTTAVTVTTPGGTSAVTAASQFTYQNLNPTVTSVTPSSGPAGTTVTIIGTHFTGATQVLFGTLAATFSVQSDTSITAIAPVGNQGTLAITVTTPIGTSALTAASQFTYQTSGPTVTSVSPASGLPGSLVNISGTNFTGATNVRFGTLSALFTIQSDTLITATVPAGNQGTVAITVITPTGTSQVTENSQFFYQNALIILPPAFLTGHQTMNQFASQTDYIHVIKWHAPATGIAPIAYRIYSDAALTHLVAKLTATDELKYKIHNRNKNKKYHYYIISVGPDGETSIPAKLIIYPHE